MIRHRIGNEFLLIAQDDHARFSGQLAGRVGNDRFAELLPFRATVDGITLHDSGWPLHDVEPTIDEAGWPTDVLHSPIELAMRMWSASVERAATVHPWSGLLVSLHVLRLSTMPAESGRKLDAHAAFEVNKFQHRQIEVQEELRRKLGLRVDLPLTLGLAPPGRSEDEDLLRHAAAWMRALDSISLDACCDRPLFEKIEDVLPRPGGQPVSLRIEHPAPLTIAVEPWPFDVVEVAAILPGKRVSAAPFANEKQFQEAFAGAKAEAVRVAVVRGGR